jgi:hypothetical protein
LGQLREDAGWEKLMRFDRSFVLAVMVVFLGFDVLSDEMSRGGYVDTKKKRDLD